MIITVDGEIIYNQLIDIWEEAESYSKEDVIEIILSVAEDIRKHGSKLGSDTIRYIAELRISNNNCPICGSKLETKTSQGYLAEAWGSPVFEDYTEQWCSECGWHD